MKAISLRLSQKLWNMCAVTHDNPQVMLVATGENPFFGITQTLRIQLLYSVGAHYPLC
jgi:hypothetical protein